MTQRDDPGERKYSRQQAIDTAARIAQAAQAAAALALTASIAREISQPLSGLITNSNTCRRMLAADPPDIAGAQETLGRTLRDANRVAELVARLRATFGEREPAHHPFDLNDAMREATLLCSGDLRRGAIAVVSELAEGLPQAVGDRSQLQLVIFNLLHNACDAMMPVRDRARELLIKTEVEAGNGVRVTIRDTGVELVARTEALLRTAYGVESGDVGIGLFVSRSIVESHHGRLWAQRNQEAPGTTFSFSLPSG